MAKKARFFLVTLKNVDEQWQEIVPAQSRMHASSESESQYIRVVDIQSYGWHDVEVYDSPFGPAFYATVASDRLEFFPGSVGYNYLSNQFHAQHRKIIDENYSDN